jgi:hypothetical protein
MISSIIRQLEFLHRCRLGKKTSSIDSVDLTRIEPLAGAALHYDPFGVVWAPLFPEDGGRWRYVGFLHRVK